MSLQFEWAAIAAVGTVATAIISFYRWIWIPRKLRIKKEKCEVYQPIYANLQDLVRWVTDFNMDAIQNISYQLKGPVDMLPQHARQTIDDLYRKLDLYRDWHTATKACIDLEIYKTCIDRNELVSKYKNDLGNDLASELAKRITPAVIKGEEIKKSWITDNTDFYRNMQRIQKVEDFDNMVVNFSSRLKSFPIPSLLKRLDESKRELLECCKKAMTELVKCR